MNTAPPIPNTTLAVILGASQYPHAKTVESNKSFAQSAKNFETYLSDAKGLNLPNTNVLSLFDIDEPADNLDTQLTAWIQTRTDDLRRRGSAAKDLIIYYVGHGCFSPNGDRFALAICRTRDGNKRYDTSYRMSLLASTLNECAGGLRKYVILDCCFSAAAYREFMSTSPLEVVWQKTTEQLPPQASTRRGTSLLCASGPRDPALAPSDMTSTLFTTALLHVLKSGSSRFNQNMTLTDVHDLVESHLATSYQNHAVRPELHSPKQDRGKVELVPFFPNPAYDPASLASENGQSIAGNVSSSPTKAEHDSFMAGILQNIKSITLGLGEFLPRLGPRRVKYSSTDLDPITLTDEERNKYTQQTKEAIERYDETIDWNWCCVWLSRVITDAQRTAAIALHKVELAQAEARVAKEKIARLSKEKKTTPPTDPKWETTIVRIAGLQAYLAQRNELITTEIEAAKKAAVLSATAGLVCDGYWRETLNTEQYRYGSHRSFKSTFEKFVENRIKDSIPVDYIPGRYLEPKIKSKARQTFKYSREYLLPLFIAISISSYAILFTAWLYALTVDVISPEWIRVVDFPIRVHAITVVLAGTLPCLGGIGLSTQTESIRLRATAIIIGAAVSIGLLGSFVWESGWRALYAGQSIPAPQGASAWIFYLAWPLAVAGFIGAILATFVIFMEACRELWLRRARNHWLPQ